MPRPASTLAKELVGHLRRLDSTRKKLEGIFQSGKIKRHDIEQVYVGIYLDAIVSFERFVEALFFGYLTGRLIIPASVGRRVAIASDAVARDIVLGGRNYVDWLPFDHTDKRAALYFRNGLPFSGLTNTERATIKNLMVIRNALAHKSSHSLKQFERVVLAGLALTGPEKTPAGYLRSSFRMYPSQTRYENLMVEIAQIAGKLAA